MGNKKAKGKVLLSIMLMVAILTTLIIFIQAKTVENVDFRKIELMKDTELRTELANTRNKSEEYKKNIEKLDQKLNEYKNEYRDNKNAPEVLNKELKHTLINLGYTDVEGEGVIITLRNNENAQINSGDILTLVNQLNIAGAEAISINEKRLIATSDISLVNGNQIVVNSEKIEEPYVIKAIGNKKNIDSALTIKEGYINQMFANSKTVEYKVSNKIDIPKFTGEIKLKYGR